MNIYMPEKEKWGEKKKEWGEMGVGEMSAIFTCGSLNRPICENTAKGPSTKIDFRVRLINL